MDFLRPLRPSWPTGSRRGARHGPNRRPRRLPLGLELLESRLVLSDGTAAATVMVKDIAPGSIGSGPGDLTDVNGTLFFAANDGTHGTELWESDGTAAGTVLVKDIDPGPGGSNPNNLMDVNGTLFFAAGDGTTKGSGLWKSDGTTAGTVLVSNLNNSAGSSRPNELTNVKGTLFFSADDGKSGRELWKSDGTARGTTLVKDIDPGSTTNWYSSYYGKKFKVTTPNSSDPGSLTDINGLLFFTANDGTHGREIWKSDGTAKGTVLVKDINPGGGGSYPGSLVVSGGHLFFPANDGVHGAELWDPPISSATGGHLEHDGRIVGPGLDNFGVRSGIASPSGGSAGPGLSRSARPAVFRAAAAPSSARLPSPFLPATALPPWLVSPPAPSLVELGTSGTDGFAGQDLIEQAIAASGTHRRASGIGPSREPAGDHDLIAELASAWPLH